MLMMDENDLLTDEFGDVDVDDDWEDDTDEWGLGLLD